MLVVRLDMKWKHVAVASTLLAAGHSSILAVRGDTNYLLLSCVV